MAYEAIGYTGLDYGQRYASAGPQRTIREDSVARDPYAEKQRAEADRRAYEMQVSEMAGRPDGGVANYLAQGYDRDKMALAAAVQGGDREKVERIASRIHKFQADNNRAIASWAAAGELGGSSTKRLAEQAYELLNGGYMTAPVSTGVDGAGRPVTQITAQSFLETGINAVGDPVANYLEKGYRSDMTELQMAARLGDIAQAQAVAKRMGQFVEDNRDGIVRWSQYGGLGGEIGKGLQDAAVQLGTGAYLDTKIAYGTDRDGRPEGEYTIAQLVAGEGMPEALKKRAANLTASRYGVDTRTAQILTDADEPMHGTFSRFLNDIAAGETMQKSMTDPQQGADRVTRAVSGMQLIGRHYTQHEGEWADPQVANLFYQEVYAGFGGKLSSSQLEDLYQDYRSKANQDGFDMSRYFQGWRDAASSIAPTEVMTVSDGHGGSRSVEVQSRFADPMRLFDSALDVSKRLREAGLDAGSQLVNSTLRTQARQADEIERTLGVSFADLGYGDALAASTAYALSGDSETLRAGVPGKSDAMVVQDAQTVLGQATHVLNIGGTSDLADSGAVLPGVAEGIRSATGRVYLRARQTASDKNFDVMLQDPAFAVRLTEGVADSVRKTLGADSDLSQAVAAKYVENLQNGRNRSVTSILEELGGYVKPVTDAQGQERLVSTSPVSYVNLATGQSSRDISATGPGLLSTDPQVLRDTPATSGQRMAARQALAQWADGSAAVYGGMPTALRGDVQALAQHIRSAQEVQRRTNSRVETTAGAGAAGAVMSHNLARQGIRFDDSSFIQSGDLLKFLEGHDKATGITSGDEGLATRAIAFMESMAVQLNDDNATAQDKAAAAAMIAELLPVVSNRRRLDRMYDVRSDSGLDNVVSVRAGAEHLDQLLLDTGLKAELDLVKSDYTGGMVPRRVFSFARIDDGQIGPWRSLIQQRLQEQYGLDQPLDVLSAAGYRRTPAGEKDTHGDYGGILARFEQLYRSEPVHEATPTGGEDHPAPELPTREQTVARSAQRVLGRTLSTDGQLNQLKAGLRRAIAPQFDTPEETQAFMARMEPLIDLKWQHGGYTAAKQFVDDQGSRLLVYRRVPTPQGEGIQPMWLDSAQMDALGRDWAATLRDSRLNQQDMEAMKDADMRVDIAERTAEVK